MLSKELELKNVTIQRLVNENRSLSKKLDAAQKEAEDLVKYTKEFLEPLDLEATREEVNVVGLIGKIL